MTTLALAGFGFRAAALHRVAQALPEVRCVGAVVRAPHRRTLPVPAFGDLGECLREAQKLRSMSQSSLALRPLRICGYFCLKLIDDRVQEFVEFPDQDGDGSARSLLDVLTVRAVWSRGQVTEWYGCLHKQ